MPKGGRQVTFALTRPGDSTQYVPRDVLGAAIGVHHLMKSGQTISIGGQDYTFMPMAT